MKKRIKIAISAILLSTTLAVLVPTTTVQAKPLYCLQAFTDCIRDLPWYVHLGGGAAGCAIGYLGCGS